MIIKNTQKHGLVIIDSSNLKIDKKKIDLKETIKTLGVHTVSIKLFEGVIGKIKVDVIG